MSRVEDKIKELEQILNLEFQNLQSFKAMFDTFQLGVGVQIGDSYVKLVKKTPNHLRFDVTIKPGGVYDLHWHDCPEVCTVVSGEMDDLLLTHLYATVGQSIKYDPMIKHMPHNPSKTEMLILTVDFYRINQPI